MSTDHVNIFGDYIFEAGEITEITTTGKIPKIVAEIFKTTYPIRTRVKDRLAVKEVVTIPPDIEEIQPEFRPFPTLVSKRVPNRQAIEARLNGVAISDLADPTGESLNRLETINVTLAQIAEIFAIDGHIDLGNAKDALAMYLSIERYINYVADRAENSIHYQEPPKDDMDKLSMFMHAIHDTALAESMRRRGDLRKQDFFLSRVMKTISSNKANHRSHYQPPVKPGNSGQSVHNTGPALEDTGVEDINPYVFKFQS